MLKIFGAIACRLEARQEHFPVCVGLNEPELTGRTILIGGKLWSELVLMALETWMEQNGCETG